MGHLDVSVVVATFGSEEWCKRGQEAAASVKDQVPVHVVHSSALDVARNSGLAQVTTDWVIFLDGDDFMDDNYIPTLAEFNYNDFDVIATAVNYLHPFRRHRPGIPTVAGHQHACMAECLEFGNYIIVGALARTELLTRVGGWHDYPVYEDWDLWLRCKRAGARFGRCPDAIYRAVWSAGSRNRGTPMPERDRIHRAIVKANS